jgi:hypothetical protein
VRREEAVRRAAARGVVRRVARLVRRPAILRAPPFFRDAFLLLFFLALLDLLDLRDLVLLFAFD